MGDLHDQPLKDLEERIAKAREAHVRAPVQRARSGAIGQAFRLSTELVAGVVVGAGIGWALDRVLGTGPWLLFLFFFLGVAAGVVNVIRAASRMNAAAPVEQAGTGQGTPKGPSL